MARPPQQGSHTGPSESATVDTGASDRPLRIGLVYDTYFPGHTGGAERWLWVLGRELVALGHEVTYVTRDYGVPPRDEGIKVVFIDQASALYDDNGVRRVVPSLRFAWAVRRYLKANASQFDALYVYQTPLWPVLTAKSALSHSPVWWGVEWIEWWPQDYWSHYAPGIVGKVGWQVQKRALAASPRSFTYSLVTDRRVRAQNPPGPVHFMPGMVYDLDDGPQDEGAPDPNLPDGPLIVTLGRLVPEKHPDVAVAAMARVIRNHPEVSGLVIGRGPMADDLRRAAAETGLDIQIITDADDATVVESLNRAAALLHPSAREGFGLVVVEAAGQGTPTVVVDGPDNAAVELIEPGVNGVVAPDLTVDSVAAALEEVLADPQRFSDGAREWYERVTRERSVAASARELVRIIRADLAAGA